MWGVGLGSSMGGRYRPSPLIPPWVALGLFPLDLMCVGREWVIFL